MSTEEGESCRNALQRHQDHLSTITNAIYGPESRNYTRWKNPQFLDLLKQQLSELDKDKRLQTLRQMESLLINEENPYVELFWARRAYVISDKLKTMASAFVPAETIQTNLKWDHVWLEK